MDILYAVIPYVLSFGVFSATYKEFFSRGIHDMLGITLFFGSICFIVGMIVYAVSPETPEYVFYAEIGVAVVFLILQFMKPKKAPEFKLPEEKKTKETKRTITLEDILGE